MPLRVAIVAGGLATRLGQVTRDVPKSLVDVAGRPFAEHQVDLLVSRGYRDIVFLVGHLGDVLRSALGEGQALGARLRYVFDGPQRLGTGGAIRHALAELGEAFFVLYGDSYLECDYAAVEASFRASGKSGLMTVFRNDGRWDASNVLFADGSILMYDKQARASGMQHIDYGLGVFKSSAFEAWPSDRAFDLAAVYQELLARQDLAAFEVPARFYEIGSPSGLDETREYLAGRLAARGGMPPKGQ